MNKKILVFSIIAAVITILLPISSVVGTNDIKSIGKNINSPLFAVKQGSQDSVRSRFLGKDKPLNLFLEKRTTLQAYADKVLKMIQSKPNLLKSVLDSVVKMPEIKELMEKHDIEMSDFREQMNQIVNDPELLKEKVDEALLLSPYTDDPVPLGLSTSNPLGCFIVALVLAPIFAMIGMIIATITIITCLNINGCFENIVQSLLDQFIQGVIPE